HDRMAGVFLSFAGLGKQAMYVVSTRCGQFILDAPDFLKHQVAAALNRRIVHSFHRVILRSILPARTGVSLEFPQNVLWMDYSPRVNLRKHVAMRRRQPSKSADDGCVGNMPAIPRK